MKELPLLESYIIIALNCKRFDFYMRIISKIEKFDNLQTEIHCSLIFFSHPPKSILLTDQNLMLFFNTLYHHYFRRS